MPRDKTDKAFKGQNSKGKNIRSESEAAIEVITLSDSDDDSSRTISDTPAEACLQHLTHKSVANNKKSVHADDADSGRKPKNVREPKFDCPKVNSDKRVDPKPRLSTDAEDEVEDANITLTSKRKIGKSNINNDKMMTKGKKVRFDEPETSNHGLGGGEPSGSGVVQAGRVKKQKAIELGVAKPSKRGPKGKLKWRGDKFSTKDLAKALCLSEKEMGAANRNGSYGSGPMATRPGSGHEIARPKPMVPVIGPYGSGLTVSRTGSVLAMALGKPLDQVLKPFGSASTVSRTGSAKPIAREIRPFGSGLGVETGRAKPIAREIRPFGSGLGVETGQANPTAHEVRPIGSGLGVQMGRANPTGHEVRPFGSGLGIEMGRANPTAHEVRPFGSGLGLDMGRDNPTAREVGPIGSGLGHETGLANTTGRAMGPLGSVSTVSEGRPSLGHETGRANPTGHEVRSFGSGLGIVMGRANPVAHEVRPFGSGLGLDMGRANPRAREVGPIGSGLGHETGHANTTGRAMGPLGTESTVSEGGLSLGHETGRANPREREVMVCSLNQNPADFGTQMAKEYRRKF